MRISTALRKAAPTSIRLTLTSGDIKELMTPQGSRRWGDLEAMVGAYDWTQLEAIRGGAVVAVLEPPDEIEDQGPGVEDLRAPTGPSDLPAIVQSMLACQSAILDRFVMALGPLLNGYRDLLETTVERVTSLEDHYQAALDARTAAAEAQASQTDDQATVTALTQVAAAAMSRGER